MAKKIFKRSAAHKSSNSNLFFKNLKNEFMKRNDLIFLNITLNSNCLCKSLVPLQQQKPLSVTLFLRLRALDSQSTVKSLTRSKYKDESAYIAFRNGGAGFNYKSNSKNKSGKNSVTGIYATNFKAE